MSVCVFAASNSASFASSSVFAFGRETFVNAGGGTTPCSRSSAASRASASARSFSMMLDTEKPMTIGPAIGKTEEQDGRYRLPNSVKPHHAMPAPI